MFQNIISKLTTATRALASFIRTSPWSAPVAAITLFMVVAP